MLAGGACGAAPEAVVTDPPAVQPGPDAPAGKDLFALTANGSNYPQETGEGILRFSDRVFIGEVVGAAAGRIVGDHGPNTGTASPQLTLKVRVIEVVKGPPAGAGRAHVYVEVSRPAQLPEERIPDTLPKGRYLFGLRQVPDDYPGGGMPVRNARAGRPDGEDLHVIPSPQFLLGFAGGAPTTPLDVAGPPPDLSGTPEVADALRRTS